MQKVRLTIKRSQEGSLLVEVLLAVAVFGLVVTAVTGAIIYGQQSTLLASQRAHAAHIAKASNEALRAIRDENFSLLAPGTYGLAISGNKWVLTGTPDIVDGIYTRSVIISSIDAVTLSITTNVSWQQNPQRSGTVTTSGRLTNWRVAGVPPGPIMMAYSKTTNVPFIRTWNGSAWSAESSAQTVGGNINYVVLKVSRTRNEAVLGTMDAAGNIYAQVWNGASWSAPTLMANVGATLAVYRGFDIDYETSGDRAVITYLPNSTSVDPAYRIWNGASWTAATTITTPPTTGIVRWIETAPSPISSSNDISMIMLDANSDVYGMLWNGTSWGTMGVAAVWDATAASATKKTIDVAYEQTTGRPVFIWGDSVATDQYYRIWNGATLTAATLLDIPASGGVCEWAKLAPRPSSNEIMYGCQDAGADLNTRKWSGSAWDGAAQHPEHSATTENITSMNYDLVWETHSTNPGEAWLMWGNSATVSKKQWSGAAWGAASVLTASDDSSFIKLKADPVSGAIFSGIYENSTSATDDIWESRLTGGGTTWSAKNIIWGGATSAAPVFMRVDIATR